MKKIIVVLLFFLLGCNNSNTLSCHKSYFVNELGTKIDITTKAKFVNGKMKEYQNQYQMNLEGEDEETIDSVFESMKDFYQVEESEGVKQIFEKGDNFILFQTTYDMTFFEDENELWGDKNATKEKLEEDGYSCE